MRLALSAWQTWAVLSAFFAALTALFAKLGVEGVGADFATFVRTIVVVLLSGLAVTLAGAWQPPETVAPRAWLFLALSGLATGASWLCYFRALKLGDAARVAPLDKLSVVFVAVLGVVLLGELAAVHWLGIALIAAGAALIAL